MDLRNDYKGVDCETAREAISALADGEQPGVGVAALDEHLGGCAACEAWREAAHEVTRRARLVAAGPQTPGVRRVLDEMRARGGPRRSRLPVFPTRVLLVVLALIQIGITVPLVVGGHSDVSRDVAAGSMALAVAFLGSAWRPVRARATSPVVGTAALMLAGITAMNVIQKVALAADEASHVAAVGGWLLVRHLAALTPPGGESPDESGLLQIRLRLVALIGRHAAARGWATNGHGWTDATLTSRQLGSQEAPHSSTGSEKERGAIA